MKKFKVRENEEEAVKTVVRKKAKPRVVQVALKSENLGGVALNAALERAREQLIARGVWQLNAGQRRGGSEARQLAQSLTQAVEPRRKACNIRKSGKSLTN